MTEVEWRECADPAIILAFLRTRGSTRKFRLFACACCRQVWDLLTDWRSRHAVEVAERFAENGTGAEKMWAVHWEATEAIWALPSPAFRDAARAAVDSAAYERPGWTSPLGTPAERAWQAAINASNVLTRDRTRRSDHVALVRCIFGNPFRTPLALPSVVLEWENDRCRRIAESL